MSSYTIVSTSSPHPVQTIAETGYTSHTHAQNYFTTTSAPIHRLYPRGGSTSTTHTSSKSTSSKKSTKTSCTNKQMCETGDSVNGVTVGVAVAVPVAVALLILGVLLYRSYRKGKKEALDDNDPDFYGETTVLPDYPSADDHRGNFLLQNQDGSFLSNPFLGDAARYPNNVMNYQNQASSNSVPSINNTVQAEPYYEGFTLPYQHNINSKHSLDEFAKQLGSDNLAYPPSRPVSRNTFNSSANSSTTNLRMLNTGNMSNEDDQKNVRNLTEKVSATSASSPSYSDDKNGESNLRYIYSSSSAKSDLQDEKNEKMDAGLLDVRNSTHARNVSDVSYIDEDPEELNYTRDNSAQQNIDSHSSPEEEGARNVANIEDDDDDDEDIKRMKSVYRVYLDRDNSVRGPNTVEEESVPPLPNLETSIGEVDASAIDDHQIPVRQTVEDAAKESQESDDSQHVQPSEEVDHLAIPTNNDSFKPKHRVVSSMYSSLSGPNQVNAHVPSQKYIPAQEYAPRVPPPRLRGGQPQYQQPHQTIQHTQFYPQAPPQNIYQPAQLPNSPSIQSIQTAGQRPLSMEQLQDLPHPSKMEYNSVGSPVSHTNYLSKKSSSKPNLKIKAAFNPLHYPDQVFHSMSPISPHDMNFQAPNSNLRDVAPPSPHHMRQSIVMTNPVEIGKQKLYRPAGSFSQLNSANSSRNASLTSQSQQLSANSEGMGQNLFIRSGSQADLRKQIGSSENYEFH